MYVPLVAVMIIKGIESSKEPTKVMSSKCSCNGAHENSAIKQG